MHSIPRFFIPARLLVLLTVAAFPTAALAQPASRVEYRVRPDLTAEQFDVSASFMPVGSDPVVFHFPIWAPGAYDLVNFGGYVRDFTARFADGRPAAVSRVDTGTYRIDAHGQPVTIAYRIHDIETPANSVWFCTSDIEKGFVFAQGAAMFGYVEGGKGWPCSVAYAVPKGWDITVSLDSVSVAADVAGGGRIYSYGAGSYDELIDAPVEMGHFQRADFTVNGVPHVVTVCATNGHDSVDIVAAGALTKRIVEVVSGFYGELPYKRYVFQHFIADMRERKFQGAFGALEHAASSSYLSPPMRSTDAFAREMALTIAHEYWHVWSPKRIHVAELGPFDYQRAPRTTSLWFAEGLTEYYARVLLMRARLCTETEFLSEMQDDIEMLYGRGQRRSIAELSREISFAPLNESSVALYSKGPIIGLLLDAAIRAQTANAKGLDDAMRFFNEQYGRTGKTFTDEDIIPIMERATGAKLADFYARYIGGREPLPIDSLLPLIGFRYDTRVITRAAFGGHVEPEAKGLRVKQVDPDGTARATGLRPGDLLVKIVTQNRTINAAEIPVNDYGDDALVYFPAKSFVVMRNGASVTLPYKPAELEVRIRKLTFDENASAATLAIRKSLIGR